LRENLSLFNKFRDNMKNNSKILPVMSYKNMDINKSVILYDNKKKSGIYCITNLINGKTYIGSSINLTSRLSIYYSKKAMLSKLNTRKSIIYSAILKHDYLNFSLDIFEYCEINILIEREQYYLDLLKPEYNILKVANSRLGSKQSEATKIKISCGNKGKHNHFLGKMHTYETRKKIGLILKSIIRVNVTPRIVTMDTILKLSLRSRGVSVKVFDKSNNLVKEFPTITSTAIYFGISNKTVSKYINSSRSYDGYTFKSKFKGN